MWFPDLWSAGTPVLAARYDFLILGSSDASFLTQLKTANPNQHQLVYQALGEVNFDAQGGAAANAEAIALPHPWFLTQVGSRLRSPIDAEQTFIPVDNVVNADATATFVVGDAVLIEQETVLVTAVDSSNRTLTVQRGFVRPASAHGAGVRIAAHISVWPGAWVMNVSTLAPQWVIDSGVGPESWAEYRARQAALLVNSASWDGVLVDRGSATQSWLVGNSTARTIDPDSSNTIPADGYAAFDQAWGEGVREYHTRVRAAIGDRLIYVNVGMPNYELLNGNNLEAFPLDSGRSYSGDWQSTVFGPLSSGSYLEWNSRSRQPNLTMIETYEDDSGPDPLGDGSYTNPCSQAGFVPNYRKMRFGLTTALLGDGYFSYEINTNGHGALCLMWFDEYDNAGAGRGYLGQSLGPARQAVSLTTASQVSNGGFETGWSGWSFWVDTENGYQAARALDPENPYQGQQSARIDVTQSQGEGWRVGLEYAPISVTAGNEYTVSFGAKASQPVRIQVLVQQGASPWTGYSDLGPTELTASWRRYEASFVAGGTDSAARLVFSVGAGTGSVWLDEAKLQAGSGNVWRRDFNGGIALVNATTTPQTVPLGGEFRKINGSQAPGVNDGSVVSQVILASRDGIVLLRPVPLYRYFFSIVFK